MVEKHRASMFLGTTSARSCGCTESSKALSRAVRPDFCVETTIRDAYYRDMGVIVVRECAAGPRQRFHDDTLTMVEVYWAAVVSPHELPSLFTTGEASDHVMSAQAQA